MSLSNMDSEDPGGIGGVTDGEGGTPRGLGFSTSPPGAMGGLRHVGGCEGDHVTIEEPKLWERGGRWCGEGSGLNVYFSETDAVVVTLHAAATTQGEYFDNPLRFKIK